MRYLMSLFCYCLSLRLMMVFSAQQEITATSTIPVIFQIVISTLEVLILTISAMFPHLSQIVLVLDYSST